MSTRECPGRVYGLRAGGSLDAPVVPSCPPRRTTSGPQETPRHHEGGRGAESKRPSFKTSPALCRRGAGLLPYFEGAPGMLRPPGLVGMPVRSATVPRRSTCGGAYGGAPAPGGSLRPEEAESEEAEGPSPQAALSPEASSGDEDAEEERDEDEEDEDEEDIGVFIGRRKRDCEERVRKEISAHAVGAQATRAHAVSARVVSARW